MSDLLRITTAGGHTFEAGFNDDGALEPAVGFDWDAVDQDVDQDVDRGPGVDPEQLISALLAGSTSAAVVGERVLLLGFVLNQPEAPKTYRSLAARLGVSHRTARLKVSKFRADLGRNLGFPVAPGIQGSLW